MPFTETNVACSGGAWTQLAPYLPYRKQLIFQCPKHGISPGISTVNIPQGASTLILPGNVFRKRIRFSSPAAGVDVFVCPGPAAASATEGFQIQSASASGNVDASLEFGEEWLNIVQNSWSAFTPTVGGAKITIIEANYLFPALILSTQQGLAQTDNQLYGPVPLGLWLTPDGAFGPPVLVLDRNSGDSLIQEWFGWLVSPTNCNVTVWQSFDDAPDYEPYQELTVQMPAMDPYVKQELGKLLDAMRIPDDGQVYLRDN